jgi:ParB/RepB/Spo0J family partition protein
MGDRVIEIRTDRIRPFATQPREYFDQDGMRDLERSIKAVGQQVEIIVRPLTGDAKHDYEMIDGQRRWIACSRLRLATMRAIVRQKVGNAEDQFLSSVIANFARAEHTPAEIAKSIARLKKRPEVAALTATEQVQYIADMFGRSAPWVYLYQNLLKLDPTVLVLTGPPTPDGKRLSLQASSMLSELPPPMQRELAGRAARTTVRGLQSIIRGHAKASGIRLRANTPSMARKRSEVSLNLLAANAESLLAIATDFKAIFAQRPRDEQESFVYRIDHVIEELARVRDLAARVVGIRERRRAA